MDYSTLSNGSIALFQNDHLSTPLLGLDRLDHKDTAVGFILDSQAKIDAINAKYGAGTVVVKGSPLFVEGRGVAAIAEGDGVLFDMSKLDPDGEWRNKYLSSGQISIFLEKEFFFDNTADATVDIPTVSFDGNPTAEKDPYIVPHYSYGSEPVSFGMGQYNDSLVAPNDFHSLFGFSSGSDYLAVRGRIYTNDGTNQVYNGLIFERVGGGIHKRYMHKLHSMYRHADKRTHYAYSVSWNGSEHREFIDGVPGIGGGDARAAIASSFYKLGENSVSTNKKLYEQAGYFSVCARPATSSTVSNSVVSNNGNPVFVYGFVMGKKPMDVKFHPDFRQISTYGDSYSGIWGGQSDSHLMLRSGHWDNSPTMTIVKLLAENGYMVPYTWFNAQGGHSTIYRNTSLFPTVPPKTMQGVCPDDGVDHFKTELITTNPTIIFLHFGRIDQGILRGTNDPEALASYKADMRDMVKNMLLSGAKVALVTYQGTPNDSHIGNTSWIPSIKTVIEAELEIKDWVLNNMGQYYADRIEVTDNRLYQKDLLQSGDRDGIISQAPNYAYEVWAGDSTPGNGIHPIYPGQIRSTFAMVDTLKRLCKLI